jgi:hypothetical protein
MKHDDGGTRFCELGGVRTRGGTRRETDRVVWWWCAVEVFALLEEKGVDCDAIGSAKIEVFVGKAKVGGFGYNWER